jgi:hypothetical protein
MAKPIRATPTLYGQDAVEFVVAMHKREQNPRLTKVDKELISLMEENKKFLKV